MAFRAPSKQSVGERLRKARTARGLDLGEAAEATRINARFLEALERDAPPEEFPEPMYARSFLREYARYLGLKSAPLVNAYRAAHPVREPPLARPPESVERTGGEWVTRALLLISVVAIGAVAVLTARGAFTPGPDAPPTRGPGPSPAATAPSPSGEAEVSPTAPEYEGVRLSLRVVDAPCWIHVARGEQVLLSGTQEPGFFQIFRAREELDLELGNAGAVRLTVNGERQDDLGSTGAVYQASFVFEDGEVKVVPASEGA